MRPGFNESLNDKMEQVPLKGLMPGFDQDVEWAKLSGKLHPPKLSPKKVIETQRVIGYAAAVAFFILCGIGITWLTKPGGTNSTVVAMADTGSNAMHDWIKSVVITQEEPAPATQPKETPAQPKPAPVVTQPKAAQPSAPKADATVAIQQAKVNATATAAKRAYDKKRLGELFDYYRTKEFICNGTPCPLQICILQTIKCKNDAPAAIATCSTLEPDQSGQLKYKGNNLLAHDCNVSIDEIRITRVNTGETIVLDANSKPSTAQDMFDYITGEKEGDLLTGIFHTDCNKNNSSQNLTIDKSYGNVVIK